MDDPFPRHLEPLVSQRHTWVNQVRMHAIMRPDEPALRFLGTATTWRELDRRISRLAAALDARGVSMGDRVLVLTLNRPEFFETVLALNALGAIAVPVNFRMAPPEVAHLVTDTGARAIVHESVFDPVVAAVGELPGGATELRVRIGGADGDALDYDALVAEDRDLPPIDVPETSPAVIMYTSGTTGAPKGAVLTHINLQAQAYHNLVAPGVVDHEAVAAVAVPVFHIAALGVISSCLLDGVCTIILPIGQFDPAATLDVIESERITTMFMVPAQWQLVIAEQRSRPRDLALRFLWWGAAPASQTLLAAMADTFPEATICAVFGQTEMSPVTCTLTGEDTHRKIGSVGRVIRTMAARIVDPDMNDVAPGEVGEIVYRGPNLMSGYWNRPDATADAFAGGWFHSGDLVRADDEGFVYVVDRAKDMIISGGENIYCVEVENAVAAHPSVREVAVIGRPDEKWGEVVVAVVATTADAEAPTVAQLRKFLDGRLARYKHPTEVVIVDELPRNAAGKVSKPHVRKATATP
ncbi:fatty-acid--CoA ligase FadD5 [Williamsia phyllosphaerae]|uniref:Long-chain-fatty-acid--CoA ligase n=1 Tax=Williamsia phyllosphaerae TaxID=885042 RepID=A0ABQ1UQM3_9NOCA|nr:fatty-acid--CoA ligase FadD5 [Williamsia phyllosphaerae]GGF23821.1 long-chain-fatty-acid--CoA ligase [Williamsia phyllosphaerae]